MTLKPPSAQQYPFQGHLLDVPEDFGPPEDRERLDEELLAMSHGGIPDPEEECPLLESIEDDELGGDVCLGDIVVPPEEE